jgi:hypothetical protein
MYAEIIVKEPLDGFRRNKGRSDQILCNREVMRRLRAQGNRAYALCGPQEFSRVSQGTKSYNWNHVRLIPRCEELLVCVFSLAYSLARVIDTSLSCLLLALNAEKSEQGLFEECFERLSTSFQSCCFGTLLVRSSPMYVEITFPLTIISV